MTVDPTLGVTSVLTSTMVLQMYLVFLGAVAETPSVKAVTCAFVITRDVVPAMARPLREIFPVIL